MNPPMNMHPHREIAFPMTIKQHISSYPTGGIILGRRLGNEAATVAGDGGDVYACDVCEDVRDAGYGDDDEDMYE